MGLGSWLPGSSMFICSIRNCFFSLLEDCQEGAWESKVDQPWSWRKGTSSEGRRNSRDQQGWRGRQMELEEMKVNTLHAKRKWKWWEGQKEIELRNRAEKKKKRKKQGERRGKTNTQQRLTRRHKAWMWMGRRVQFSHSLAQGMEQTAIFWHHLIFKLLCFFIWNVFHFLYQ